MFVPYETANDVGDRFLDLLHRRKIQPLIGSAIEDELLSLTELIEVIKNPNLAAGPKQELILRTAAGVHDLAAKVLSVETIQEFSTFIPHLQLIAQAVTSASVSQNVASAYDDDTARKIAELYIGCLAAHVGTKVELDHPTNAKGNNPDVIFTVQTADVMYKLKRWALAIKTISSKQGQTIFQRIEEGAAQIDSPKCQVDTGMVVINTKSALDHSALWNSGKPYPGLPSAIHALRNQIQTLADSASKNRSQSEWDVLFHGKVVRPVIFMGHSVVVLPTQAHKKTPTPLKMLLAYGAQGGLDPIGAKLACGMNDYMQTILKGIPGSSNQRPC